MCDQKTFVGGFENVDKFNWRSFVNEINKPAYKTAQAPSVTPGVYKAVVNSKLIGLLLHEAFGHASEEDSVYTELSALGSRMGVVDNEKVTMIGSLLK